MPVLMKHYHYLHSIAEETEAPRDRMCGLRSHVLGVAGLGFDYGSIGCRSLHFFLFPSRACEGLELGSCMVGTELLRLVSWGAQCS